MTQMVVGSANGLLVKEKFFLGGQRDYILIDVSTTSSYRTDSRGPLNAEIGQKV
jgi:hypothetical protein